MLDLSLTIAPTFLKVWLWNNNFQSLKWSFGPHLMHSQAFIKWNHENSKTLGASRITNAIKMSWQDNSLSLSPQFSRKSQGAVFSGFSPLSGWAPTRVWLWPVGRPRPNWVAGSTFGRAHAPKSSRQARPRQCADSTRPKTIFCTLSSLNRNSKFLQSESEKWRPVDHVRLRQIALSNCQIALYYIICKSLLWYFMHWYCRNDSQKLCIVLFCPVQNRTYDIGCHLLMTKTKTQRMFIIFTKIVKFSPPQIVNQDFPLNYYIFTKNCPPNSKFSLFFPVISDKFRSVYFGLVTIGR